MQKQELQALSAAFSGLSSQLRLIDENGKCLIPEHGEAFPALKQLPGRTNHRIGEWLVRTPESASQLFLVISSQTPSADDLLALADSLVCAIMKDSGKPLSKSAVCRQILLGELSGQELENRAREIRIPQDLHITVILFRNEALDKQQTISVFRELLPLSERDLLVEMDQTSIALVRDMTDVEETDEILEFTEAVLATLLEETGCQAIAGIGTEIYGLSDIHRSYLAANKALEVGTVFHPTLQVYQYEKLKLERFLSDIPLSLAEEYQHLLFNEETAKVLNEEMLQTIEMFFEKDLNLSDTSRQMYIHRNTLVYRLEKLQRATGLDLRQFSDAVTFKILYELKKTVPENR